ncbi:DMT family transporter [Microbacterium azadirachtae]|uniref:DMT family transporter n=1 Tax=Microbacterium azadirachtae TaxID=582680 RepID=UPI0009E4AD12|nr:DMT family transporter [Microbacterium azadirachtae]
MPLTQRPAIALAAAVALWSAGYPATSWALHASGSVAVITTMRFGIAAAVLVVLTYRRPGFREAWCRFDMVILAASGITLYYALSSVGLLYTTPGTAALLGALLPVLIAFGGWGLLGERPSLPTLAGLTVAVAGVALIAAAQWRFDLGVVLNAAAVTAYASYALLLRKSRGDRRDPLVVAAVTASWGALLMLPWVAWEIASGRAGLPPTPTDALPVLLLACGITIPTLLLYTYAAAKLPAAASALATAAIPALGYLFAVALGEPWEPLKALGGAIALLGVVVGSTGSPKDVSLR